MNRYYCSDGSRITESQIKKRLSKAVALKISIGLFYCKAHSGKCPGIGRVLMDPDHTVAKARCKQLHKTELIWDIDNIEWSCRQAHEQWESYKSGEFTKHANFEKRMAYMKIHDPEGWQKRMNVIDVAMLRTVFWLNLVKGL